MHAYRTTVSTGISKKHFTHSKFMTKIIAAMALVFTAAPSANATFVQTDLVSDIPGLAAITAPRLENPWGLTASAASPFWVANQMTNSSTLYAVSGRTNVTQVLGVNANGFVGIPTTGTGPQGPTGVVSNSNTAAFQLTPGNPATSSRFIFANLNGTISGWAGGLTATIEATTPGAVYTGLAINSAAGRLYVANGAGGINVFDGSFAPVGLPPGSFVDPNLPAGLVPFNVQILNGKVYVTYAPTSPADQRTAALGIGVVDVFDQNGVFLQRLITGSQLASPWGLALAPASFGQFGGDLLVGNFSFMASGINAFDSNTGVFEGSIPIDVGSGNTAGGLWALMFGTGSPSGGDPNTLYFTDGIDGETHGLFGAIQAVPAPSSLSLLAAGLGALGLLGWRRKKKPCTARGMTSPT
jgi:uncharacterized protein (TIGR03118 family)